MNETIKEQSWIPLIVVALASFIIALDATFMNVSIAQVVADWQNVFYNQAVANIDGKNGVDLQDVVHLAQYVAKWENIVLH